MWTPVQVGLAQRTELIERSENPIVVAASARGCEGPRGESVGMGRELCGEVRRLADQARRGSGQMIHLLQGSWCDQ